MNIAEKEHQRQVRDLGCIACIVAFDVFSPCDIHHILSGGRRIDEYSVIGLCPRHHRGGESGGKFVSRHPWKARFILEYGTEDELLAKTQQLLNKRII